MWGMGAPKKPQPSLPKHPFQSLRLLAAFGTSIKVGMDIQLMWDWQTEAPIIVL